MGIYDCISLYANMDKVKKPDRVTCAYNPSDGEAELEDPWD